MSLKDKIDERRQEQQRQEMALIVEELDVLRCKFQTAEDKINDTQASLVEIQGHNAEIRESVADSKAKVDRMITMLEKRLKEGTTPNITVLTNNNVQTGEDAGNENTQSGVRKDGR